MKKISSTVFEKTIQGWALFCIVIMLASCQNFMKGQEIKDEINRIIDYNNAPSYTITIDSDENRGVVKSPAGGQTQKKVTDVFTVSFTPSNDYAFFKWKIIDSKTKEEFPNGKYLSLESLTEDTTNCTFTSAPESGRQLTLYAVVAKRPRVISNTPQISSLGAYRDARIKVIFDKAIETKSIYYDTKEMQKLKDKYGEENIEFLPPAGTPQDPKYYGYTYENQDYFKNIQIVNQKNPDQSMLNYFDSPYFEDPVTLVIPPKKDNPPPGNTNLSVAIESAFSTNEEGKSITLKEEFPWMYFVNSKTDKDPPSGTEILKTINDNSAISKSQENPTMIYNKKIKIYVSVQDSGSGPDGKFKLRFTDVTNPENITQLDVSYNYFEGEEIAAFKANPENPNDETPKEVEISGLSDGVYKLNLVYYDKNLIEDVSSDYFVRIDATAPVITDKEITSGQDDSNGKASFDISYTCNDEDFKELVVKYKKYNTSDAFSNGETFAKGQPVNLKGLNHGTQYRINMEFYDDVGNCRTLTELVMTPTGKVKNLNVTTESDYTSASASLTWQIPDGQFASYDLWYKLSGSSNYTKIQINKSAASYTINNLLPNRKYDFRIITRISTENSNSNDAVVESTNIETPLHKIRIEDIQIKNNFNLYVRSSSTGTEQYEAWLYYSESPFVFNIEDHTFTAGTKYIELSHSVNSNIYYFSSNAIGTDKEFDFGHTYYFMIVIGAPDPDTEGILKYECSELSEFTIAYTVTNLKAEIISGTKARISWKYPAPIAGLQTVPVLRVYLNGYELSSPTVNTVLPNTITRYEFPELSPDTQYEVEVKMIYNNAYGSQFITIETPDLPTVSGLAKDGFGSTSNGNKTIKLKWDDVPKDVQVDRYLIKCRQITTSSWSPTSGKASGKTYIDSTYQFMQGIKYDENGQWNLGIEGTNTSCELQNYIVLNTSKSFQQGETYDILIEGYELIDGQAEKVAEEYITVKVQ